MKNWKSIKTELLTDPEVRIEYEKLEPQYELIKQLIRARQSKRFTQAELAKKIGTGQSAISRFESGSYNPSFRFLQKVATAVGKELVIAVK